jgi:hypothetical protein
MPTRREFGKMVLSGASVVGLSSAVGMTTMGLSCSSVFTDISNYVPLGIQAFDGLLEILSPSEATALAPIITAVKAAFADLAAAVTAYENAPSASKATLVGKITTAINVVMAQLQQFWSDANLPDGTLASTIEAVLQIILSTLAAFLPLLGGNVVSTKKALKKTITYAPKKRTKKQFKADVNNAFAQNGYSKVVIY